MTKYRFIFGSLFIVTCLLITPLHSTGPPPFKLPRLTPVQPRPFLQRNVLPS